VETFFLACFLFGVIFTLASVLLGLTGSLLHAPGHGNADLHLSTGHASHATHHGSQEPAPSADADHTPLPIFNISSLLAFATWFGAAGFVLTRFAGWPSLLALIPAVLMGAAGAVLIAAFIRKLVAGEQVMRARDYRLEGTIGRVTVSIPAGGVGEVVFSQAGRRRSEAARSLSGRPIPRDTEVVILDYERGIAAVQPWDELVGRTPERERRLPPATERS
jgi:membrane protein implicated in regulation of membrane protease activity